MVRPAAEAGASARDAAIFGTTMIASFRHDQVHRTTDRSTPISRTKFSGFGLHGRIFRVFIFHPMITISVVNMKGGVAKTTLAVNLADCLVRRHEKKVLVVDVDPQFNASQCLLSGERYKS